MISGNSITFQNDSAPSLRYYSTIYIHANDKLIEYAIGSPPDVKLFNQNLIAKIEKDTIEKKTELYNPSIQIEKMKKDFEIKDETILDENIIIQKIPRIITISDALNEQRKFLFKRRQKEKEYHLKIEREFEKIE